MRIVNLFGTLTEDRQRLVVDEEQAQALFREVEACVRAFGPPPARGDKRRAIIRVVNAIEGVVKTIRSSSLEDSMDRQAARDEMRAALEGLP